MIWWNRLRARIKALRHREQLDRDLQAELQFHLDMQSQAGARRRKARRQFGNVTSLKEACIAPRLWQSASQQRRSMLACCRAIVHLK
jgi:hypothetical protein